MNICDGVEIPDIEKIAFYTIASSQKLCGNEEKFDILAQVIAFFDYELQSKIFSVSPETKEKLEAELLEMKKSFVECQKKIMDSLKEVVFNNSLSEN
ncbi:MAG: hypothetical protein Q4P16_06640 [Spirochaetales bacterium]|nr:hypothetical protein [Spirochaetales bacterium]